MKINNLLKYSFLTATIALYTTSCFNDLDTIPLDEDEVTSASVYDDPSAYKQVLAKVYAGLAVSGQQGPSGQGDISGIDEGFGQYLRGYWYHQQLPTDEAVIGWNDQTIKDFHEQDWDANDNFINAFYARIFYQISLTNEFIRETTEAKLDSRGVDAGLKADVQTFRAEARFLRALSYWHALDLFRNVPFVTENDAVGAFFPEQTTPDALFNYIESELKEIETLLPAARSNEYGRADQAAAQMLLAKLYLNAEVYIGTPKYTECAEYCDKVLSAGYSLDESFSNMFMADNNNSSEIIFPVRYDGVSTRTWGGTTFIIHAAVGGDMDPNEFGIDGGWSGIRTTSAFVNKFPALTGGSTIVAPVDGNTDSYPAVFAPGAYQGWDPGTAPALTSRNSDNNYEGYLNFTEAGEFKITPERDWDEDFGAGETEGSLAPSGQNIAIADPGFYQVKVDLNELTISLLNTSWGIIGDATPGGWDADTDMTFNAEEGAWEIQVDLVQGEIKFRANDDWGLNFGDDGADAILEEDGGNIAIPSDGNYIIKLYLDRPDYTYSIEQPSFDRRAMFFTENQNLEIEDISLFNDGYAVTKWKNVTSSGEVGSNLVHTDTDFPMFRLADAHLMYAEAVLRGGNGDRSRALSLVNEVRARAYGDSSGSINDDELTLDWILDERSRELAWECHRRTDLIRFGQFTAGSYLWPWKGGVKEGAIVDDKFNVFPIPANDIGANPNLRQNTGY